MSLVSDGSTPGSSSGKVSGAVAQGNKTQRGQQETEKPNWAALKAAFATMNTAPRLGLGHGGEADKRDLE